jgi:hypothetical protein
VLMNVVVDPINCWEVVVVGVDVGLLAIAIT